MSFEFENEKEVRLGKWRAGQPPKKKLKYWSPSGVYKREVEAIRLLEDLCRDFGDVPILFGIPLRKACENLLDRVKWEFENDLPVEIEEIKRFIETAWNFILGASIHNLALKIVKWLGFKGWVQGYTLVEDKKEKTVLNIYNIDGKTEKIEVDAEKTQDTINRLAEQGYLFSLPAGRTKAPQILLDPKTNREYNIEQEARKTLDKWRTKILEVFPDAKLL